MAKIDLNNLKFEKIMKEYAHIRETTIPNAVHMNARLLCVEFARRTQPFGNSTEGSKVGEKAITKDILGGKRSFGKGKGRRGLFQSISGAIAAQSKQYSTGAIKLFANKKGEVYGTDTAHFLSGADVSTLRAIHKTKFVNGRMSAAGGDTRDIGRWKFIDQYFVPPGALSEFLRERLALVGLAKSGWAHCATQLRRVVGGSMTRGIPGWVTRHKSKGFGSVQDFTSNLERPYVVMSNSCRYADRVLPVDQQLQGMSIVATKMKKQMEMILKKRQTKLQEAA